MNTKNKERTSVLDLKIIIIKTKLINILKKKPKLLSARVKDFAGDGCNPISRDETASVG